MRGGWVRAVAGAAVAAAATGGGAAAEGPSFDCGKAEGAVEEMICADADLSALDRRLAAVWAQALAAARAAGADLAGLRAEQRGWIGGRNACRQAEDARACAADAYLSRLSELAAFWELAPETGRGRWVCGDGDEVTASFRETPIPSARITRGGETRVGLLRRTASGARYDMAFGAFLWMKGEAATLAWREGEETRCEAAE